MIDKNKVVNKFFWWVCGACVIIAVLSIAMCISNHGKLATKSEKLTKLQDEITKKESKIATLETAAAEFIASAAKHEKERKSLKDKNEKLKKSAPKQREIPVPCLPGASTGHEKDANGIITLLCKEIRLEKEYGNYQRKLRLNLEAVVQEGDKTIFGLQSANEKLQLAIEGREATERLQKELFNTILNDAKKKYFKRGAASGFLAALILGILFNLATK